MNQAWKKHGIELRTGICVTGKWHNNRYTIKRKLGNGAVGTVYLCEVNGKEAALKISEQSTSMTMEVNVLKALGKVQGNRLGPCLIDVDDWEIRKGKSYSFYVMEYLEGKSLSEFVRHHGSEWIGVFMLQLLDDLERLHQSGWVFGDFKMENLLVLSSPPRVRWIDVGGTTQMGRAIKEYTEFYDRGYWGLGSRRAEPGYDLFAFAMVFLTIFYPSRFEKGSDPKRTLFKKLYAIKPLHMYRECLKKAILGNYQSSAEMKDDLTKTLYTFRVSRSSRTGRKSSKKAPLIAEAGGIGVAAIVYYLSSVLL